MTLPTLWAAVETCGNCGSIDATEQQVRICGRRSRLHIECRDCGHIDSWLIDHDDTFANPSEEHAHD